MKEKPFILVLLYSFFFLTGRVNGIGEKVITMGAGSSWTFVEKQQGVIEASQIRPHPVLVLASLANVDRDPPARSWQAGDETSLDLCLSFDEKQPENFADSQGRYDIFVSPELTAVTAPWNRLGNGAVLFNEGEILRPSENSRMTGVSGTGGEGPIVVKPRGSALFAPGSRVRDFSIEFWLYPLNMENGGQILSWTSSKPDGMGGFINQRIQCVILKSRIQWNFGDFFFSPGERERKSLSFSGPPVLPRSWSHHLIRFDADLGLLEYLVDGRVEALDYTTSSGREGGEVFTPVIGEDCRLVLGGRSSGVRFSGIMDEFRIYRSCLEKSALAKYPPEGGRVEFRTLDLGNTDCRVLKVEAFGGRTGSSVRPEFSRPGTTPGLLTEINNSAGRIWNEYAGNNNLNFSDHSSLRFFIRMNNSPYLWNDVPWVPFYPGTDLPDSFRGRYIQLGVDFYPGEDGETSPYLAELKVIYNAAEPPSPPARVVAVAKDGAVDLSWNVSPSRSVGGYLVYFGTARGEYFGDRGILGSAARVSSPREAMSPIDAGNRTSIRIEGLNNGTLYYFAVAAYNEPETPKAGERILLPEPGDFSREAAARPLRMAE